MKLQLQPPLKFWGINQAFGANFNSFYTKIGLKGHNGIDFWAPDSTPVYATHDGRVTFTGYDGAGGLGVVIRTTEQFDYGNEQAYYKSIYWHLKRDTIKVTGGQTVKAGDLIAFADNTGRSTGSHLHFGLKPIQKGEEDWVWFNTEPENGYNGAIDPMPYFDRYFFSKPMRFGDEFSDVGELQKWLNKQEANLKVDNKFGKFTKQAVINFQLSHSLVGDGIVGKKTLAELNR